MTSYAESIRQNVTTKTTKYGTDVTVVHCYLDGMLTSILVYQGGWRTHTYKTQNGLDRFLARL